MLTLGNSQRNASGLNGSRFLIRANVAFLLHLLALDVTSFDVGTSWCSSAGAIM